MVGQGSREVEGNWYPESVMDFFAFLDSDAGVVFTTRSCPHVMCLCTLCRLRNALCAAFNLLALACGCLIPPGRGLPSPIAPYTSMSHLYVSSI